MSYSQLQFAKSEALFIQDKFPDAYQAYLNGIDGHMEFVNLLGVPAAGPKITGGEISAYKASSEVAPSSAELKLSDIMSQKYISQWGWAGLEQWCDLRKYDYDTSIIKQFFQLEEADLFSTNAGKYAQRVRPRYNSEYVWNREELARWGALLPSYNVQKLWFCKPE